MISPRGRGRRPVSWRLRSLDREGSTARSWLADHAALLCRGLDLHGLAALLRVPRAVLRAEVVAPAPAELPDGAVTLALAGGSDGGGERAVLGLPSDFAGRIVDLTLGRPSAPGAAEMSSGEEGALLFAFDRAGGDWIAAGGTSFRVRGVLHDASQAADYLGRAPAWQLTGALECGDLLGPVWVWSLGPPEVSRRTRPPVPVELCGDWPVRLRVVTGRSRLPADQVAGIAARDVLILDECCHPLVREKRGEPRVISGGLSRRARWLDRDRLELVSTAKRRLEMRESSERDRGVTARLEEPVDGDVGAMEVEVQVELGRVTMTLDQALGLLRGAILELGRDVGPAVQLRAGDKLIARGELVDCEGQLAVEITEVP